MGSHHRGLARGRAPGHVGVVMAVAALVAAVIPTGTASPSVFGANTVVVSPATVYLPVNGTATLTARVIASNGAPVGNWPVSWSSTGGATFSPQTSTTGNSGAANGVATTVVTAAGGAGPQTIAASAGTVSGTSRLYAYGNPATVAVQLQPVLVPANGAATSQATVTVTDAHSPPDPIPNLAVTMARSGDVAIGPVSDHGDGTYEATITASHTPANETITATETSQTTQISASSVLTEYGAATNVAVSLSRTSIPATGTPQPPGSSLHLNDTTHFEPDPYQPDPPQPTATATVTDINGSRVANEVVRFSASGGATFGAVTNNGDGTYTAPLTSSARPGTETITAVATNASVSGSTTLRETFGALHTTAGNTNILDANNNPVMLRGVNIDPQGPTDPYLIQRYYTPQTWDAVHSTWNANTVRAFIDLDQWMQPCPVEQQHGDYDPTYKQVYTEYAKAATQRGMYVIFVLGRNPRFLCDPSGPKVMAERDVANPADDAAHFWTSVANTFKDNPMVGFELFNEPHSITDSNGKVTVRLTDDAWLNGGAITDTPTWTAAGMQEMYNAIRATGATNLVIVDGQDWANRTPPALISSPASATHATDYPATNIVYNVHYYSCPTYTPANPNAVPPTQETYNQCSGGSQPQPTDTCATTPTPAYQVAATRLQPWVTWRSANGVPVMEDEFGWPNNTHAFDSCFTQNTIAFDEANNIPWMGFVWTGWYDRFGLAAHPDAHDYTPTISGQPVKSALANNQN